MPTQTDENITVQTIPEIHTWIGKLSGMNKVGEMLLETGKINSTQLDMALSMQKSEPKNTPIGQIFMKLGAITEEELTKLFAEKLGVPYIKNFNLNFLHEQNTPMEIYTLMFPIDELSRRGFIPYKEEVIKVNEINEWHVYGVFYNPWEYMNVIDYLSAILRANGGGTKQSGDWLTSKSKTNNDGENITGMQGVSDIKIFCSLTNSLSIRQIVDEIRLKHSRKTEDTATTKSKAFSLLNSILTLAVRTKVSDIHLSPFNSNGGLMVRYRRDGTMIEDASLRKGTSEFPIRDYEQFSNVLLEESHMSRDLRTKVPQDGTMTMVIDDVKYDMRIASMPTAINKIHMDSTFTIRILNSGKVLDLNNIGLSPNNFHLVRKLYTAPAGILLLTGPTGSGKTTTIYSILQRLDLVSQTCYTIEDPIEYELQGAYQVPVNNAEGRTFPMILRNLLRQDPDMVLVGEIRDVETLKIAMQIANTGHSVFSTIHANSAYQVPARMQELGVTMENVGASVIGVISQRLIPANCPECRVDYHPTEDEILMLDLNPEIRYRIGTGKNPKNGQTCPKCLGRGVTGRIGVYEVMPLMMEPKWVEHNSSAEELEEFFAKPLLLDENGTQVFDKWGQPEPKYPNIMHDVKYKLRSGIISPKAVQGVFSRVELFV